MLEWLTVELFSISNTPITPASLLQVVLILAVTLLASKLFRKGFNRVATRNKSFHEATIYTLGRLSHYVILLIGLLAALSSVGINLTNLALIGGALGVGIGFGLQPIVVNFVSGLIILFERNLKVGDFIELVSGVVGKVREINVRSTLVTTMDNIDILVPNSEFINGQVTNWTLREGMIRVHIPFGVAYGSDKDSVESAAQEAMDAVEYTLKDDPKRKPQLWMTGFGDSSLDFALVVWITPEAVAQIGKVKTRYYWELESSLTKRNITIPFPQRDLHLVSGFTPQHQETGET